MKLGKAFRLGLDKMTLEAVEHVALGRAKVFLSPRARKKVLISYRYLQKRMGSGETIYGVNTGFGPMSDVRVSDKDLELLQANLLRTHAVGTGNPITIEQSRAMLFLRAANLAIGNSGIRPALIEKLLELLNKNITPWIPEQGSVGASGDLAPLAHLSLVLMGEGRAYYGGKLMDGGKALKKARIKPLTLGPKEGLALINGTQFMTAIGALAVLEAEYLCNVADLSGAMSVEAMKGTYSAFDADIQKIRPHPGQILVARRLREILTPKGKHTQISKSHENCGKVQDPYSLRCMPQIHGASRDALKFVRDVLEREIDSVTDNPLIFPSQRKILSGGNFHGQYVAMAMDIMAIAMAEIADVSECRIEKLINPALSGLPAFLAENGGLNSGFMIVQYAAASIVSENKTLCHPAVVDSIPTSADKEDHVSMGAWAARKAATVVTNTKRVLAMELLSAAQGIDFHRPLKSSPVIENAMKKIRSKVKSMRADRAIHPDIEFAEALLTQRELQS